MYSHLKVEARGHVLKTFWYSHGHATSEEIYLIVQLRQLMYAECITLQIIKFARDTKKSSKVALKALKNATIISNCLVLLHGGCGIAGFVRLYEMIKLQFVS